MLGLSATMLDTIVGKQSEIEKSYLHCGPSFSKECKSLKTSLLEELETILAAGFKQTRTANASVNGPHLKEKALHVADHLGIDSFWVSDGWTASFKKRHNLVCKTMSGESATVIPETVMDWKSEEVPKIIEVYWPKDLFHVGENGLFCNLQPSKTLTYTGDTCHGGTQSKQRVNVLLDFIVDGTEKSSPLVTCKYNKPHCFRNVKNLPTKDTANSNSWMTSATFEELFVQLNCQIWTKNIKILPSLTSVLHTQEIQLPCKILKLYFSPPNCTSHLQTLDMGSSMLSNASTESNSYGSQYSDERRITW
jgi:hypothetical protein